MGRGWPTAVREGQDVTERVVAEARGAVVDGSAARIAQEQEAAAAAIAGGLGHEPPAGQAPAEAEGEQPLGAPEPVSFDEGAGEAAVAAVEGAGGDQLALGVELAALLGPDASRLLAEWREVAGRATGLSPSETLALAERKLRESSDRAG